MAIKHIEIDSGIYRETQIKINGADIEPYWKGWGERCVSHNPTKQLGDWLSALNTAAIRIVESNGGTIYEASAQRGRTITRGQSGIRNEPAPPVYADAVRAIHGIDELRPLLKRARRKDIPTIILCALRLGMLADRLYVRRFESHSVRGRKILSAAQKSGLKKNGPHEQRVEFWRTLQVEVDRLRVENPEISYTRACDLVAQKYAREGHPVSKITVLRRTTKK